MAVGAWDGWRARASSLLTPITCTRMLVQRAEMQIVAGFGQHAGLWQRQAPSWMIYRGILLDYGKLKQAALGSLIAFDNNFKRLVSREFFGGYGAQGGNNNDN